MLLIKTKTPLSHLTKALSGFVVVYGGQGQEVILPNQHGYLGANLISQGVCMEQGVIFRSVEDAQKVADQLPQAQVIGRQVFCKDKRALELAIALTEVKVCTPIEGRRMPYPEQEFTYNGDCPRIYVRCLSAYNSGLLHGLWINATQHVNDIWDSINWMLSWSPVANREVCEEWAIHDDEGFGCYDISDHEDLEIVSSLAKAIKQHGEVLAAYIACEYPDSRDIKDKDWDELIEQFQSVYVGHFESEKDFALKSEEIEEMYNFKDLQEQFPFWASNIDWEGVATDLFCSDYYSVRASDKGYGIYVFRNS